MVAGINWAVSRSAEDLTSALGEQLRDVIYLPDFGLAYPITLADKIDNWEAVRDLWLALHRYERPEIRRIAAGYVLP